METLIIMLLLPLPLVAEHASDPVPFIWQGRQELRNLDCTRMSQERAHELYPGQVPEPAPRTANLTITDALVCTPRIMKVGERNARDEVVLSSLRETTEEITEAAAALAPADTVWHVDGFYPDARVASKVAVAARIRLAEHGHKVSDQVPMLAAGDLLVLRDRAAKDAYPLACKRYFDEKILKDNEAFLGIMLLDSRETQLHAGVCVAGGWRWLR